ncbi:hypothetical protein [Alteromonas macleodii]|uniref:Uncharacterized protein n=1 Tax=Alteromonas macleodii TaxID=28108 RepID=A0AB36FNF5_ALTMA|nr:hypothetical protein [Alteromonas macleodii]OES24230.1 hypothetical protein BFV93_4830 [Alteromonas macleodii]OES24861.1 hypothetical protein BFV95_4620 [Alteromonas macleodii]OES25139.1 hypothetical protein BFV94_4610 [Alteromonas macleodii]OES39181.1 hypothetical protein BFV96_4329 [Alteromonas macleodii]
MEKLCKYQVRITGKEVAFVKGALLARIIAAIYFPFCDQDKISIQPICPWEDDWATPYHLSLFHPKRRADLDGNF